MAYTHSRYKRFQSGGAVLAEDTTAAPELAATIDTDAPISSEADDPSIALQKQIAALRASEEIQRQRAAAQSVPPLSARQMAFVEANPDFMKNPEIAKEALMAAHRAGHEQDSQAFHAAVKKSFDEKMMMSHPDLSVEIFPPERAPQLPMHDRDRMASYVSAPVSRESASNGYDYSDKGSRVKMTPQMKEAARIAGISEVEYAEQVLRLRQEKAEGNYGGAP
jgi:hypothetical protein